MNQDFMSFLPLILMTLIGFFVNYFIAKKLKVLSTGIIIFSLIPFISYFLPIYIYTVSITNLMSRLEELEGKLN